MADEDVGPARRGLGSEVSDQARLPDSGRSAEQEGAGVTRQNGIERCVEEAKLLAATGDHIENPTMSLAARAVLGSGQKPIEVVGPFPEIEDELLAPHRTFWRR